MRVVSAVAMLLRRVRAERGVLALVFVVVAVTAFAVAAAPRLFEQVASDGLRYEVAHGTAIQRNIQFSMVDRIDAGLPAVDARGSQLEAQLPGLVGPLVERERSVIETPRLGLDDPPHFTTLVTLHQQPGYQDLVDLAVGRWPQRAAPAPDPKPDAPPVIEVALSTATAQTTGMQVGRQYTAAVDPNDGMLRLLNLGSDGRVAIDVTGLFTVRDPADPAWFDDHGIADAPIGGTADAPIAYAKAIYATDAYPDVLALDLPMRYQWNLFVDPARLDASDLGALTSDLQRLESSFPTIAGNRAGGTLLRTGLLPLINQYRTKRVTTEAAVTLAAVGPLAVAAGAVALLGILVVRRRRPALRLARGRGASGGQLLLAQAWEGLLITVPAAVAGLLLADAIVGGRPNRLSTIGAVLVALAATLILTLASVPIVRRARRDLEREDPPAIRLSPRRLVFEVLIVGISLTAAWLLRERGLSDVQPSETTVRAGFDPFLAASPLLVGLAVALVIIRLYPIPVRVIGWLTALRRDLVPVLGLRSIGRHPAAGYLPLLILTLTMAIGTLSAVLEASLVRSQVDVSWQDVGADYRIQAGTASALDPRLDVASIPGVQATADGLVVTDAALSTAPGRRATILVEGVDPVGYDAVLADSPVARSLTTAFGQWPTDADAGTTKAPIPAILSNQLPTGAQDVSIGDVVAILMQGKLLNFEVVGRTADFPGVSPGRAFAIVPFRSITAASGDAPPGPSVVFARGDASVAGAIQAATARSADAVVVSRHAEFATLHDTPLVAAMSGGFLLAVVVAAAYAALAVVTVAALEAQRRSREIAFLRTLGLTDRQVSQLTVIEQGAPVIIALVAGVALGLGLAWLVEPGLDLSAFSGTAVAVGLELDWPRIVVIALGIVAVVAAAVAGSSWMARRLDVGHALRIGED